MQSIEIELKQAIVLAVKKAFDQDLEIQSIVVETPKNKDHGDFVIHRIRQMRAAIKEINDNYKTGKVKMTESEKSAFVSQEQENCFFDIREKKCNPHTVYYLLRKIEETETKSIRTSYFNLIFNLALPGLNQMIKNCKEKCSYLVEDANGSIDIFGKRYQIVIPEELVA